MLNPSLRGSLNFLLVPDRGAARQVRSIVAESVPRLGVQVGTWVELTVML